jgi:hypothetical protein
MADEPEKHGKHVPFRKRLTLSLSAFIMSLGITLLNAYGSLRGAEIVVPAPNQVLLYRDGSGENAILNVAVRMPMINTTEGFGDLLLEAGVRPQPGGPNFRYNGLLQPVFTDKADDAAAKCDLDARCIPMPGLLVVERADDIVDIPGGAARSHYFGFPLTSWNCKGTQKSCGTFSDFRSASARLAAHPLDVEFMLRFSGDGERRITCRGGRIDAKYLAQIGWISLPCEQSKVSSSKWL